MYCACNSASNDNGMPAQQMAACDRVMSKTARFIAASGRHNRLIASCKPRPGSSPTGGRATTRERTSHTSASTSQTPEPADHSVTLRPRPSLRVLDPQRGPNRGAPELDGASVTSRWTHVQINNDLARAQSLDELFQIVHAGHQLFNEVNAVTALHRIARVRRWANFDVGYPIVSHGWQLVT